MDCPTCDGKRTLGVCEKCEGKATVPCSLCGGTGQSSRGCWICEGAGSYPRELRLATLGDWIVLAGPLGLLGPTQALAYLEADDVAEASRSVRCLALYRGEALLNLSRSGFPRRVAILDPSGAWSSRSYESRPEIRRAFVVAEVLASDRFHTEWSLPVESVVPVQFSEIESPTEPIARFLEAFRASR